MSCRHRRNPQHQRVQSGEPVTMDDEHETHERSDRYQAFEFLLTEV